MPPSFARRWAVAALLATAGLSFALSQTAAFALLAASPRRDIPARTCTVGSTIGRARTGPSCDRPRVSNTGPATTALSAGFFGGGNNNQKPNDQQPGGDKISQQRRRQLGINPDEDEYDLGFALEQNTDPVITKVIAGSFILVMIALLVYAVVIPSLTVYDEGICR